MSRADDKFFQLMQSARYGGFIHWTTYLRHPVRVKHLRRLRREYRKERQT